MMLHFYYFFMAVPVVGRCLTKRRVTIDCTNTAERQRLLNVLMCSGPDWLAAVGLHIWTHYGSRGDSAASSLLEDKVHSVGLKGERHSRRVSVTDAAALSGTASHFAAFKSAPLSPSTEVSLSHKVWSQTADSSRSHRPPGLALMAAAVVVGLLCPVWWHPVHSSPCACVRVIYADVPTDCVSARLTFRIN